MKELLKSANIPVPLLSPARHGLCYSTPEHPEQERICAAYKEQVIIYITNVCKTEASRWRVSTPLAQLGMLEFQIEFRTIV